MWSCAAHSCRGSRIPLAGLALGLLVTVFSCPLVAQQTSPLPDPPPEQIIFAGDANYPPFEWLKNGEATGFNVELAQALTGSSGRGLRYELGNWPDVLAKLERGDVDVAAMFSSGVRDQRFLFSTPFYFVNHGIYAAPGAAPVYTVTDLVDTRVAVEDGSFALERLQGSDSSVEVITTPNTLRALQTLMQGEADYAILAIPTADRLRYELELPVARLGPPFWPASYVFAVRQDRAELMQWLQGAMDVVIGTGRYQAIFERWQSQLEYRPGVNRHWWLLCAGVLALLLVLIANMAWAQRLRARVRERNAHLNAALERADKAEARVDHLYHHDVETGLLKPQRMLDKVDNAIRRAPAGTRQEFLFIQLARLNEVTKLFGGDYARELIHEFAGKLRERHTGITGYFGRGMFAVFGERSEIQELLSELTTHDGQDDGSRYEHIRAASALCPEHSRSSDQLALQAETALAVASTRRQRWLVYDPGMEPDADDLEIISYFRDRRLDGLYPVFQPQVDLRSGKLFGAEALVRWQHPELGTVSPAHFVPLVERAGLAGVLTSIMLDHGIGMAAELRAAGLPSTVSVNIAASDLTDELPGMVEELLEKHAAVAKDLKLELTETSVAQDFGYVRNLLEKLQAMGVRVAVDDFGTGYSSLSYLSLLPIHEVKIDRSFISDMAENERNLRIVQSTIRLARELGLHTVAEGAEDEKTLHLLAEQGCHGVQGFVFSKPLPAADFLEFARNNARRRLFARRKNGARTMAQSSSRLSS